MFATASSICLDSRINGDTVAPDPRIPNRLFIYLFSKVSLYQSDVTLSTNTSAGDVTWHCRLPGDDSMQTED